MLILAKHWFFDGTWNVTPDEPSTISLALVGLAVIAVYAFVTGWRPTRRHLVEDMTVPVADDSYKPGTIIRRAA